MEVGGTEPVWVLSLQVVRELDEGAAYRLQVSNKGEGARGGSNKFQGPATTGTRYRL